MAQPPYDPSLERQKLNRIMTEFSSILRAF
jgi:hypothetical protein